MTTSRTAVDKTRITPAAAAGRWSAWNRSAWAGRIASGLPVAFLLFDAIGKLLQPAPVVEGTVRLGYQATVLTGLGLLLIGCLTLYLIPRTAVLGAVLLTGYLGGAVASHVRIADPLFSHVLFPVYVALLLWGGLWIREGRLRALLPIRTFERHSRETAS